MTLIKNDMLIFDPNEIVRLRYDLLIESSGLRLWVEYQFKSKGGAMILNTMSFNIFKLSNTNFLQVSTYTIVSIVAHRQKMKRRFVTFVTTVTCQSVSRIFNFNVSTFKLTRMIINFFLTTLRVLASNRYDDYRCRPRSGLFWFQKRNLISYKFLWGPFHIGFFGRPEYIFVRCHNILYICIYMPVWGSKCQC